MLVHSTTSLFWKNVFENFRTPPKRIMWLPNPIASGNARWVWAFRNPKQQIVVTTNNGIEAQNKVFKYDYITPHRSKTLTGLMRVLINDFLPDTWRRYVTENVTASAGWRLNHETVPPEMHHRPQFLINHIRMSYQKSSEITSDMIKPISEENGHFEVLSSSDKKTWYSVKMGFNDESPKCTCRNFQRCHIPCKHFAAVFHHFPQWNFSCFPASYRDNPIFLVDEECVTGTISTVDAIEETNNHVPWLTCSSLPLLSLPSLDSQQHLENLSGLKEFRENLSQLHSLSYLVTSTDFINHANDLLHDIHTEMISHCPTDSGIILEKAADTTSKVVSEKDAKTQRNKKLHSGKTSNNSLRSEVSHDDDETVWKFSKSTGKSNVASEKVSEKASKFPPKARIPTRSELKRNRKNSVQSDIKRIKKNGISSDPATIVQFMKQDLSENGIPNLGQTCFFNAALQLLKTSSTIYETLANHGKRHKAKQDCIPCSVYLAWNGSPKFLLDMLPQGSILMDYSPGEQYDSNEFFLCLLQHIASEEKNDETLSRIRTAFTFELIRNVECTGCSSTHVVAEIDTILNTDMPPKSLSTEKIPDIISIIGEYMKGVELTLKCQKVGCSSDTANASTWTWKTLPNILCISLKRWTASGKTKFAKDITLNLSMTCPATTSNYKLIGTVVHRGRNASNGHYLALVHHLNQWWCCDDAKVTECEIDSFPCLEKNWYYALYERQSDE